MEPTYLGTGSRSWECLQYSRCLHSCLQPNNRTSICRLQQLLAEKILWAEVACGSNFVYPHLWSIVIKEPIQTDLFPLVYLSIIKVGKYIYLSRLGT